MFAPNHLMLNYIAFETKFKRDFSQFLGTKKPIVVTTGLVGQDRRFLRQEAWANIVFYWYKVPDYIELYYII